MSFSRRLRRALLRLVVRAMPRRRLALALAIPVAGASGCMSAMTPRGKLDDGVQELNLAARFGRVDLATEHVSAPARKDFIRRHRLWGGEVRIADFELGSVEKSSGREAVVLVGYSWFRPNEGTLRTTVVRQTWQNDEGTGPWFLVAEERASGDVGLLGEPPVKVLVPARETARFETTVIR